MPFAAIFSFRILVGNLGELSSKGLYRGYIGILEKKMEATMLGLGFNFFGASDASRDRLEIPLQKEEANRSHVESALGPSQIRSTWLDF